MTPEGVWIWLGIIFMALWLAGLIIILKAPLTKDESTDDFLDRQY
jgi:hypothetical protein